MSYINKTISQRMFIVLKTIEEKKKKKNILLIASDEEECNAIHQYHFGGVSNTFNFNPEDVLCAGKTDELEGTNYGKYIDDPEDGEYKCFMNPKETHGSGTASFKCAIEAIKKPKYALILKRDVGTT